MTLVSNDFSWWSFVNASCIASYFVGSWRASRIMTIVFRSNLGCGLVVAASAGVVYDWALSFGQEVELVWNNAGHL
ncbi:uncharacterized protein EDB91DRAFT_1124159 [Suillus paluster]|uniref:uncharacterized protein n=1 Tax=Suillus paluster TaxID=48578 RepID=UPI001B861C74|nr:uncharacterized protein EDB91DRAFT_1124159 [Suillus paluster]KAG1744001.1 hypothetical protein EDB91DRAFT_1124159 [Suillus paluster]